MPYILAACMETFDKAAESKRPVTKQDLLQTLYIDEALATRNADTVLDTLRLTSHETTLLQGSRASIFWILRRRWSIIPAYTIANHYQS